MSGLATLNSTALTLATMLGLAVGIDHGLFITARHRSELQAGVDGDDSIRVTVGATGSAVVVAAITVVVALVSITLLGIPFLTVMGLGAAGTVLVAVTASLTLVPALLGLAGDRIARPPQRAGARPLAPGWARRITGAPIAAIVGVVVVLGVIAIPVGNLRLALPDDSTQPTTSTQYRASQLLAEGFGPGFDGPLTVVALPSGVRRRGPGPDRRPAGNRIALRCGRGLAAHARTGRSHRGRRRHTTQRSGFRRHRHPRRSHSSSGTTGRGTVRATRGRHRTDGGRHRHLGSHRSAPYRSC